jgi:hypothetical protein
MGAYNCGIDLSNTGCIAITHKDKVIDVLKYPKLEIDTKIINAIDKEIKALSNEPRTKTKIKLLKAEKAKIKRRAERDYRIIYCFLREYKENINIAILEEPILQMGGMATTANTIASNFKTLGVYLAILSVLQIKYKLKSPSEWHKEFPFEFEGKLSQKERRQNIKQQSIQFAKDKFSNIDDYLIRKGCRNEDDNIAEACLLSLCFEEEYYE